MTAPSTAELPAWYRSLAGARLVSGVLRDAGDICLDSRRVTPGAVFVAIPGLVQDGNAFIPQALASGASAVVVQADARPRWQPLAGEATIVEVPDARAALAQAAAGFFGHPARSLGVIGVTGTDGKTTTTHLIAHVLNATGLSCGLLSSVEFAAGGAGSLNASHMTTLEAPDVQRQLATIRAAGDVYAVVEASSIGLDMHRVDECEFDVGVFTNLTQDHLDYHGTMASYRDAKAILFRMLGDSAEKAGGVAKCAVLNAEDPASEAMRAATRVPVRTFALNAPADVSAHDITLDDFGTTFAIAAEGEMARARSGLLGDYNVANCLAATAVALSQGVTLATAAAAFESFAGVPGRMERIEAGQPFRVIVDIASTEQSMANVLRVLRAATPGRLIVVFGAAGERDIERRSGIARAVASGADCAIITNEDPRTEDADAIIDEIARALVGAGFAEGHAFERVPDRRSALRRAFELASPGDTVLLAGKGTEQSIVIGTTHHPWDERTVARELLR